MPDGSRVVVTGMGVVSSIAHDVASFAESLRAGICGISRLRHIPTDGIEVKIGAEIRDYDWKQALAKSAGSDETFATRSRKILSRAPESIRLSAGATAEALAQSGLLKSEIPRDRIGLIVAGSNLHQRYIHENGTRFQKEPAYINPAYALFFLDTSQIGCLSELFGIHGMGYTVGGASASGNATLYQAWQWIRHGVLEACVVTGASADFSAIELQAFSILGAACGERYNAEPEKACRPFDRERAGFVFGEGTGCVVLENLEAARRRNANIMGELKGGSLALDGNSLPNPSVAGEGRAMRMALQEAGVGPEDIDYINAHGTSSILGDQVESEAIATVFEGQLDRIAINSTKSMTGHCLHAAGIIEFAACLIQLNQGFLHPNLNLSEPIHKQLNFAGSQARPLEASLALSNGFGFGGFNSSLVIGKMELAYA